MDNVTVTENTLVIDQDESNGFTPEEIAEQQRVLLLLLDMEV